MRAVKQNITLISILLYMPTICDVCTAVSNSMISRIWRFISIKIIVKVRVYVYIGINEITLMCTSYPLMNRMQLAMKDAEIQRLQSCLQSQEASSQTVLIESLRQELTGMLENKHQGQWPMTGNWITQCLPDLSSTRRCFTRI